MCQAFPGKRCSHHSSQELNALKTKIDIAKRSNTAPEDIDFLQAKHKKEEASYDLTKKGLSELQSTIDNGESSRQERLAAWSRMDAAIIRQNELNKVERILKTPFIPEIMKTSKLNSELKKNAFQIETLESDTSNLTTHNQEIDRSIAYTQQANDATTQEMEELDSKIISLKEKESEMNENFNALVAKNNSIESQQREYAAQLDVLKDNDSRRKKRFILREQLASLGERNWDNEAWIYVESFEEAIAEGKSVDEEQYLHYKARDESYKKRRKVLQERLDNFDEENSPEKIEAAKKEILQKMEPLRIRRDTVYNELVNMDRSLQDNRAEQSKMFNEKTRINEYKYHNQKIIESYRSQQFSNNVKIEKNLQTISQLEYHRDSLANFISSRKSKKTTAKV